MWGPVSLDKQEEDEEEEQQEHEEERSRSEAALGRAEVCAVEAEILLVGLHDAQ